MTRHNTQSKTSKRSIPRKIVFLFDVDNTLLDNDRVVADFSKYIELKVGLERSRRYWAIFDQSLAQVGYADYLAALQRLRNEYPRDQELQAVSRFLINYPFANRLLPNSLDVIKHVQQWGTAVLLTDGDIVYQPRKVERSGLLEAVDGKALIYAHKEHELGDVSDRFPADHYVMVDDKLRILAAIKGSWGRQVTTVFARQGRYALDPKILSTNPAADVSVERIGALLDYDLRSLLHP